MSDKNVVISITETEEGLEVRINEEAYGNIAVIGLIEKIKFTLLEDVTPTKKGFEKPSKLSSTKYDA